VRRRSSGGPRRRVGRTHGLGPLEQPHRLLEPVEGPARRRAAALELRARSTLEDEAVVVRALVLGGEPLGGRHGLGDHRAPLRVGELIGQRQQQHDERLVIAGIDGEDVLADALRLRRLVEQAVTFCLRQGRWDRAHRDGFQVEHGFASCSVGGVAQVDGETVTWTDAVTLSQRNRT